MVCLSITWVVNYSWNEITIGEQVGIGIPEKKLTAYVCLNKNGMFPMYPCMLFK